MRAYETIIKAISPVDGEIKTYFGPTIKAPSRQLAIEFCEQNGLGYCHIGTEVYSEVPCDDVTYTPDWVKQINYHALTYN